MNKAYCGVIGLLGDGGVSRLSALALIDWNYVRPTQSGRLRMIGWHHQCESVRVGLRLIQVQIGTKSRQAIAN